MEVTLRIPNNKIVLSIGMERVQTSRKSDSPAEEAKHTLASIEKEREYAINQTGLYLAQLEMIRKTAAF
jgi:hypothetical protein